MDQSNSHIREEENLKDSVTNATQSFGDSKHLNYGSEYIGVLKTEVQNQNQELIKGNFSFWFQIG